MDPSDRVKSCNLSNFLWQLVSTWPLRKIRLVPVYYSILYLKCMCHFFLLNYIWMLAVTWIILAPVANVSVSVKSIPGSLQWQGWSWCRLPERPKFQSRVGRPPPPCPPTWWGTWWGWPWWGWWCWQATCWCKCPSRWWGEPAPGVEIRGWETGSLHWGGKLVTFAIYHLWPFVIKNSTYMLVSLGGKLVTFIVGWFFIFCDKGFNIMLASD